MAVVHGFTTHAKATPEEMQVRLFFTPDGWLTRYALACGYQEYVEVEFGRVRLYSEHGAYHVRSSATNEWETFDDLVEARQAFAAILERLSVHVST